MYQLKNICTYRISMKRIDNVLMYWFKNCKPYIFNYSVGKLGMFKKFYEIN